MSDALISKIKEQNFKGVNKRINKIVMARPSSLLGRRKGG